MISVISDVHIKKVGDEPYQLMMRFLDHEKVQSSEKIFLLGDIFDLLVGGDKAFFNEFGSLFEKIQKLLTQGKDIFYLDGNHDFHLEKFFKENILSPNFYYSAKSLKLNINGSKYFLCHGDDIEIENPSYRIYSAIIRSFPIKILAEEIVPFSVTKSIGDWASSRSRKKNISKYSENEEYIREKFRRSADLQFEKEGCDFIVSGHSHVKDKYNSEKGFVYLNNGYVPVEKTFLHIKNGESEFINLSDSSL